MKVLMACAGGMSSGFIADAICRQAQKQGENNFEIKAISDSQIKEELNKATEQWDVILLAPQVKFQIDRIKKLADPLHIPVYNIEGKSYTMIGAVQIYEDIKALLMK